MQKKYQKTSCGYHVVREGSEMVKEGEGSGRVRVFYKASQDHGWGNPGSRKQRELSSYSK